ncbi:hypothetical protein F4561_002665 [Lipingzhangella halophila]|uniref:DUF3168 domain-containing protein n=1 Tax=Lipingzhangella halophila TaxID=1783352 RepID=A0A7W7W3L6_9ACTN|nr:hypothetical protein [Lipingzhangella halophila]MBB4931845.1 hypothetical protein [Lipingzhangella halophila]
MQAPVFGDAELVLITWLRDHLGGQVEHVCSELPGPDEYAGLLPIVHVTRLPSPPMANPYALDRARMAVTVHVPSQAAGDPGRPGATALASTVGAAVQTMRGRTVDGITVSTVRDQTGPEIQGSDNEDVVTAGFTCVLLLRPQT